MSIPQARKGRHAAPRSNGLLNGTTGRRVAAAAAALTAGAVPLACAGSAHAAATPQPGTAVSSATLAQEAGSVRAVALGAGDLAASTGRLVTGQARSATDQLAEVLPVDRLVPQLATQADGRLQLAPHLLHEGALGTLSSGIAPTTDELAGSVLGKAEPLLSQLHRSGVPTIGDVTGQLSRTRLPMVGNVGGLTEALPVTDMLGYDSPVTGALEMVSEI